METYADILTRRYSTLQSHLSVSFLINEAISNNLTKSPNSAVKYFTPLLYLNALAFELVIKIYYMIDTGEIHPQQHSLHNMFNSLNQKTQEYLRDN